MVRFIPPLRVHAPFYTTGADLLPGVLLVRGPSGHADVLS